LGPWRSARSAIAPQLATWISGAWWPSPIESIGSSLEAQTNSACSGPSHASLTLKQSSTEMLWNLWFGGQSLSCGLGVSTGATVSVTVSSA
jgi:hypothetical protein